MHSNRNQRFYQEYMGTWTETEADRSLREMAEAYVKKCEDYDRTVCTGPIKDGAIMPNNARESSMISRHALEVREHLLVDVRKLGFSRLDFLHAARRADRELSRSPGRPSS